MAEPRPTLDFVAPGDPDTLTGGYLYDARICRALVATGWRVTRHRLDGRFPFPDATDLALARERLCAIATGRVVVIDGLAMGAMPEVVAGECARLRLVGLVHHPLALEDGLEEARRRQLEASERAALAVCRAVVCTSEFTARLLASDYGVPRSRLHVVEPGTDPAPLAAPDTTGPLRLLCVATVTPRKGHGVLIDALAALRPLPWTLDCVGSLDRCPATTAAVRGRIATHGLEDRIHLHGELAPTAVERHYRQAHAFVLASRFEGYGMAYAEALAHGLPVVGTRAGATGELVPADAGLLVVPDDVAALARALEAVITDRRLRARLARGAWRARGRLPDWAAAARRFARILEANALRPVSSHG